MQHLIVLAFGLTIVLCLTLQGVAGLDNKNFVEKETNIKNAELNALLAADSNTGVHDNQSGREARQLFGLPFGGGVGRGGFGRRGFGRRGFGRRGFGRRGGFFG